MKTQIAWASDQSDQSLRCLRSAWASAQSDKSSLSAWRNIGSLATHWVHSEDSDQTGRMPRLIRVFAGCTLILLVLSCHGSHCCVFLQYLRIRTNDYCICQFRFSFHSNVCVCVSTCFKAIQDYFTEGIKLRFPCINICQVQGEVLKTEVVNRGFCLFVCVEA